MKKRYSSVRGVTLTELLVVLAIISLLSSILLPTVVNKMQEARFATARQEVRELAQGEQQCASIHGFFVPLQVLDDLNPTALPVSANTADTLENDLAGPGIFLIDPNRDLETQDGTDQTEFLVPLNASDTSLAAKMYFEWAGPFVTFHRYFVNPLGGDLAIREDYPLDPWGQPYLFFAPDPFGLIGLGDVLIGGELQDTWKTNTSAFDGSLLNDSGRDLWIDQRPDVSVVNDRFAIMSLGPDGETSTSDAITDIGNIDDVVYQFGGPANVQNFKAFF